jgi:hypothetical protein
MYIELKDGTFILKSDQVMWIKWLDNKHLALLKLVDGSEEWLRSLDDFNRVREALIPQKNSNDLKVINLATTTVKELKEVAKKKYARDYHKPADLSKKEEVVNLDYPHHFVLDNNSIDKNLCFCGFSELNKIHITTTTEGVPV